MLRTKASFYAVLSVIEIARRQGDSPFGIQASAIAEHFRLPPAYVAKVLTLLVRGKILRSDRGPRGGFQLARQSDLINFLDIVEAVDGPIHVSRDADMATLGETQLGIERVFAGVAERARSELAKHTIGGFLALSGRAAAG